jgi:hypothetical protein
MPEIGPELAKALAAFQKELPKVAKDKTAKMGSYSYTYADLATLTHVVLPVLTKHGLSFVAAPRATESGYELAGVLVHSSGQTIEGSLPIYGRQPQEIGSAVSYARRYLLGCLTGVVTEDDDDGKRAAAAEPTANKDWDAVADTAESLTESDAVRDLWRAEGVGKNTPKVIKDRITAHLESLVKAEGETP